jgi:hypothetical protein
VLAVLLVVVLVVVLLSCCCHCLRLLCCRVANTAAAATVGMPPPPPPPSVSMEVDVISLFGLGHQIDQWKKSGTQIHHGLRRPPNTNKNENKQPKTCGLDREEMRHAAQPAGSAGGARFDCFWAIKLGYSVNN